MPTRLSRLSIVIGLLAGSPALGADPDANGYVHLGGTLVKQADDATLYMGTTEVAGAGFQTRVGATLTVEAGVFLRDGFALAASAMLPTSTDNVGTGSIAALGNLGDETVGLYSATAQYHLGLRGPVTPYAGAGIGYMHVFDTVDGAVSGMSVAHAFGGVVQLGVDVALTDNIGFFMDYKQYFISTRATGTLMGNVIYADARVDPLVITSGVSVSF